MLDEQTCVYCTEKKSKIFSHNKGSRRIYTDSIGNQWHGSRCPECYAEYKTAYDIKRRAKKGHTAIGSICICSNCNTQFELLQGHSPSLCLLCKRSS
jgi:hypothetical protein